MRKPANRGFGMKYLGLTGAEPMQRLTVRLAAVMLALFTAGVTRAEPVGVTVNPIEIAPGTWEIWAQVASNPEGTSGIAGYAFDVVDIDINDAPYQAGNAWTQNPNLSTFNFNGGFEFVGFNSPAQSIVGDSFYSVGSSQNLNNAIFGIGVSPVSMPGAAPPDTQINLGVPVLLGVGNFPGTDFTRVEIGLYAPGNDPTAFLGSDDVEESIVVCFCARSFIQGSPPSGSTIDFGQVAQGNPGAGLMNDAIVLTASSASLDPTLVTQLAITGDGAAVFDVPDFIENAEIESISPLFLDMSLDVNAPVGAYEALLTFGSTEGDVTYNLRAEIVPEPGAAALIGLGLR